jgi:hypothetical protein
VVKPAVQPVKSPFSPEVAIVHRPCIIVAVCLTLLITITSIRSEEEADRTVENLIESILAPAGERDMKRQDLQALLSKPAEAMPMLRARIRTDLQRKPVHVGPVLKLVSDFGPAGSDATPEVIECIAQVGSGWETLGAIAVPDLAIWADRLKASDDPASGELLRQIAADPATAESVLIKVFDDDQTAAAQRLVAGVALYRGGVLSSDRQITLLTVYKKELAAQALRERWSRPSVGAWDLPDHFSIAHWMANHENDWIRLQLCESRLPQAARPIVLNLLDYRSSEAVLDAALDSIDPPQNSREVRHFMGAIYDHRLPSNIRLNALGSLCAVGQSLSEADASRLLEAIEKPPEGLDQQEFINRGIVSIGLAAKNESDAIKFRFQDYSFESRFLKTAFVLCERSDVAYLCGKSLLLKTTGGKELFRGWLTDGDPKVQRRVLGILESEPGIVKEFRLEIRRLLGNQLPDDLSTGLSAARAEFALTQDFEAVRSIYEAALAHPEASVRAEAVALLPPHRDSAVLVAEVLSKDVAPRVRLEAISRLATSLSADEAGKLPPTPALWSAIFSNARYKNEVGQAARRYLDECQPDVLASAEGVLKNAVRHESPLVREEALKAADKLVAMNSLSLYFQMLAQAKSDRPSLSTWSEVLRTTLAGTAIVMNSERVQSPTSLQERLLILSDSSDDISEILSAISIATKHDDEQVRRTAEKLHEKLLNALK